MTLTARQVETAKPQAKNYKLTDGDGLYLFVSVAGGKSWRYNYLKDGKQKTVTYGRWPEMGLSDARAAHRAAREAMDAAPKAMVSTMTFAQAARDWLAHHLPTLKSEKHKKQVENTLERFVLPKLGAKLLAEIKRVELVEVVKAVQKDSVKGRADDRVETAHRVASRINAVFNYVQDAGVLESHPAANLTRVLKSRKTKVPMACIPKEEVGQLLRDIHGYAEANNEGEITRLALEFASMTFARTNEIRLFEWDQLKENGGIWVAPEEIVKGEEGQTTPHVIPLSVQAQGVLEQVRRYTGESRYVFESQARPGHPISENTMLFALYRLGYRGRMTVHGFRSLFSTVVNELAPAALFGDSDRRDVVEKQLNHSETNEVRAAYNRALYLPARRALMQWYSDWLDGQRAGLGHSRPHQDPASGSDRHAPA